MPDTIPWFNDLPIAVPASGSGGWVAPSTRCWFGVTGQCPNPVISDLGLCAMHITELREAV